MQLNKALNGLSKSERQVHDFFLHVANKYVAHSEGLFEDFVPVVWVEVMDGKLAAPASIGIVGGRSLPILPDYIDQFKDVIAKVAQYASDWQTELGKKLQAEVEQMTAKDFQAMPDANVLHQLFYDGEMVRPTIRKS